ncbi:epsin-3 isoform X2 [Rhododendron vialii]|uniref:epsin-3 isoform X2 n=1 Tax=Rhododendron vialii TaxID=182163 RepID=UPI00265F2082|nr:epsin-3 isoform X2 [Rhododendron vialii]
MLLKPNCKLAEEATNNDPCSPDAKTMTQITQASFDIDDYWRIADILHRRFYSIDLKQWRQYYKSMALLEFLLTHGPEEFAGEFRRDYRTIQELGTFQHTDENGFDWGKTMRMRSERILELLSGGERLKQARLKALKITKEIQGFGSSTPSPSSSSPSKMWSAATFGLNSASSTPSRWEVGAKTKHDIDQYPSAKMGVVDSISIGEIESEEFSTPTGDRWNFEGSHCWERDCPPVEESGSLLDSEDEDDDGDGDGDGKEEEAKTYGFISGICSKFGGKSPSKFIKGEKVAFRSLSDVGKVRKKKVDHQFSKEY